MQSLSCALSDIFITGGNGHETDETFIFSCCKCCNDGCNGVCSSCSGSR